MYYFCFFLEFILVRYTMTVIEAKNIAKSYINNMMMTNVLKNINLTVEKGEFLAIMGPSGAGKSTLLHILSGLDKADSGQIIIRNDKTVFDLNSLKAKEVAAFRNQEIGFVFQFHHLLPEFTALENIMLPAMIAGDSTSKAKSKAVELLELIGLKDRAEHLPAELSGGEQQRVAILRAVINKPKIIFADEPTGNLDMENSRNVIDLLIKLKNEINLTMLVATHSNEVSNCADRIIRISNGMAE